MTISELIFISIGLAMDSCTMATYLGMSSQKLSFKKVIQIGIIFGIFQAIMPLIGYLFGNTFAHFIEKISHWIAFLILAFIGINMIKESEKEVQLFKVLTIKEADIGISMGITGTDVTKGASDMVLADDNFATIVNAVEEGRKIYDNIRKVLQFQLATNAAEVIYVFLASVLGVTIVTPAQLLWINMVTAVSYTHLVI